jgi:hypothetical protein
MARVTQNSARQQSKHRTSHTQRSIQAQVPRARTASRTASRTATAAAHCTNITARTHPYARHTQHAHSSAPHTSPTENHTHSHTRPPRQTHLRAVRLPSVDGMLPERWLLPKLKNLQDTRTAIAIASHHGTPPPTPASRPQRIAAHRIASIKPSQANSQSEHCVLSLTHNTVCE